MFKQIMPYLVSAGLIFTPSIQGLSRELKGNELKGKNSSIEQNFHRDSLNCSLQANSVSQKYQTIKHFIESDGFKKKKAYPSSEWRMIAFSNIAEGLVNYAECHREKKKESVELLEKIIDYSLKEGSSYDNVTTSTKFNQDGLYLSHLNIMLGSHAQLSEHKKYVDIHTKVTDYLVQESLKDGQAHVRSYAKLPHKWPADQAATLYSLFLYDRIYGTHKSVEPIKKWKEYIHTDATNKRFGLPYSNISGKRNATIPRGCALAWTVRYMNAFDSDQARSMWAGYKKNFYTTSVGLHGFREWPKGMNFKGDSDSGPIIQGVGVTASAFGLVAAKVVDDKTVYRQLNSARGEIENVIENPLLSILPGVPSLNGVKQVYQGNLAKAVLFYEASLN